MKKTESSDPLMELNECLSTLSRIARTAVTNREKIAALDRLAKLSGWYRPTSKEQIETDDPDILPGLRNLSEQELRKLAGLDQ